MDELDCKGKVVLLRLDLNSSVEDGRVCDSPRFIAHAKTVRELVEKGGRVVVLAHQGRPGDDEFLSLEEHAVLLRKRCKGRVKFVPDVIGPEVARRVKKMADGSVLLLDNVRFLSEESLEKSAEEHSKSFFVRRLAPLAQAFVNDAYSVSHRSHCSVTGFASVLPSFAGRVLEGEYVACERLRTEIQRPCYYVLGGVKPEDVLPLLEYGVGGGADKVFVGGALAWVCEAAKGTASESVLRKVAEKNWAKHVETLKKVLDQHPDKVVLPLDYAIEEGMLLDLGPETAKEWASELKDAKTVLLKGVLGKVEYKKFAEGTRKVLRAALNSDAFVVLSGGSYAVLAQGMNLKKKPGHESLAGGAFIAQLLGKKLPGVEALAANATG
ncbi:phosphoglycerate kinase [Candidatus Micrarchaeota archaeon CG1_02_51_15]|nr:MAG: phosphoglycerate kinase [Candidatus Micrarchaeota archaeon CG1_02_51_15]